MQSDYPIVSPSKIGDLSDPERPILADLAAVEVPHRINPHRHRRGQLVFASHGSLQVTSTGPTFMVPSQFAIWIPPEIAHSVTAHIPVNYSSLFVDPSLSHILPHHSQLLHLTTLFKELTRYAAEGDQSEHNSARVRLNVVILDLLQALQPARVALPIPTTSRLHQLVSHFMRHPDQHLDLEFWSAQLSMSTRSLTRHFKQETGMTLGQWLQHLKVLKAIELLEAGESVKATAFEMGYQQPSAFISMFKRVAGQTPKDYLLN